MKVFLREIIQYLFGMLALSTISVPFLTPTNERGLIFGIILGLLILTVISSHLLFSGKIEASSSVLAISLWVSGITVAALSGGVSSPIMFSTEIIAIIFGLLLRQVVGKILIGMSIMVGFGMIILTKYGVVLPQFIYFSDRAIWFILIVSAFFLGLVGNHILQRLDDSLKQSQLNTEETISKTEAMFRAIFDNINDGMIYSDENGLISFRSPTFQKIDGFSNKEWGKMNQFDQIHPDDLDLVQRNWQSILENPTTAIRLEYRLRHKNGTWVWVETILQNLLNDPDIRSVVLTTHNINERKQVEEALRRSEAKFRAVVENSHDGILFLDAENNIVYRSPSYIHINGYTDEERLGRNSFDIVHPDDIDMLSQIWAQIKQMPESIKTVEYRIRHKNGNWIWVESTLSNLLDDPDIGVIILNSRDITEKKYLEQVQRESFAKMEKLFEILPVGIAVLDGKRSVVKQNQALFKILKLNQEDLAAKTYTTRRYIHPDGTLMAESEFASSRVLQGETTALNVETGILTSDGEIIWTNVSATQVPFSDWQVVVVTSDITDRKQYELKLKESEERFRSLIEQSSEGIILTDESGIIIEWNRAQAKMTGIPQEKAIGVPIWEMQNKLMLPERRSQLDLEMIKARIQSIFSNGTSPYLNQYVEYEIKVDGVLRSILQISFPIKTEKGYRLGNITRDVTEIKEAEASLRKRDMDLLNSTLEERQHLARELHDSIGQVLGYVSFQTDAARKLYSTGKAEEADLQLKRLASIAQDAHADVREYILNLRTAPTSRELLFTTLKNYLEGFSRNYNIQTRLTIDEDLDENMINGKAQLNIFRIAQEALSNVRKHADAHHVFVTLNREGEHILMIIEDDGLGFDTMKLLEDDKPHFGLRFMNERIDQLQGNIRFELVHPSGTRIIVKFPITKGSPS